MNGWEQVEVSDARLVARDSLRAGACGDCGGTFDTDQMIELTLCSTRPAQVTALLHPTCAMRVLEQTPIDLTRAAVEHRREMTGAEVTPRPSSRPSLV